MFYFFSIVFMIYSTWTMINLIFVACGFLHFFCWYVEKFYSISEMVKLNNENDSISSLAELLNKHSLYWEHTTLESEPTHSTRSTFLTFYTRFILLLFIHALYILHIFLSYFYTYFLELLFCCNLKIIMKTLFDFMKRQTKDYCFFDFVIYWQIINWLNFDYFPCKKLCNFIPYCKY